MNIPYYTYHKHDFLKQSQVLPKTSVSVCFIFSLPWTTKLFTRASPCPAIETGFPSHILP